MPIGIMFPFGYKFALYINKIETGCCGEVYLHYYSFDPNVIDVVRVTSPCNIMKSLP